MCLLASSCLSLSAAFSQASQPGTSAPARFPAAYPSDQADLAEAHALIEQGKAQSALLKLQELRARTPYLKGLAHELGRATFKNGAYSQAASYFKQAIAENPDDKEAIQLRGLALYYSGSPAEAIPLLEQVRSWYLIANVDAAYVLGLSYLQTRNYEWARKSFAEMYGVPGDSAASYLFLARMLLRQGFDPIAEESAQRAAALDPKLPLAHFLLGEFYLYKSKVPEAIKEFQTELALNPGYAGTYDRLADSYFRTGKLEDAQKLLQRSILLDSTSTGPFVLLGKVLLKKGEPDLAARYLQKAAQMDPNNFITHHLLGETYHTLGKKEDSERELKLAEQLQSAQNPTLQ